MRRLNVLLTAVIFLGFVSNATAKTDILTLQRADGSSYEMEGEVKRYEDGNFVKDVDGWNKARWGMTGEQIKTVFKGQVEELGKPEKYYRWYVSLDT